PLLGGVGGGLTVARRIMLRVLTDNQSAPPSRSSAAANGDTNSAPRRAARVRSQAGRSWLRGVQWAMPKAQCGRRVGRPRFQLFRQWTGTNLTEAPLQPSLCAKTEDPVNSEAENEPARDQN